MDGEQSHFGNADSLITIDIGAIVANWQHLDSLSPEATETAAVVKADAYGLGAARIGRAVLGAVYPETGRFDLFGRVHKVPRSSHAPRS